MGLRKPLSHAIYPTIQIRTTISETDVNQDKLLPCPFCGGKAEFDRYGDHRASSIVACTNCGCRLESNETGEHNGSSWNRRRTPSEPPPETAETDLESIKRSQAFFISRVHDAGRYFFLAATLMVFLGGIQAGLWFWLVFTK